ncbi:hypothetical protein ACFL19_00075 [Pseudomonadota bacterium]
MESQVRVLCDLPTIYADMNVYRYVAYGDISIKEPERFKWVYSFAHLDEMARSGNTDALEGIKFLNAVEINGVLNESFESVGHIILREYVDPRERYNQHLEAIAGNEGLIDLAAEQLLRLYGADNFNELSLTPEKLLSEVDRLTSNIETEKRTELLERAKIASVDLKEHINTHHKNRLPVDQIRLGMGLTSEGRKEAEKSNTPIDELWKIIGPSLGPNIQKNQFFGFEPLPGVEGRGAHTQDGSLAGAHIVLNMLGLSPDKGMTKREKIKNIISDSQHVGMASYCCGLLSADRRFCDKANAIYTHVNSHANVLWFQYKKGSIIQLGIE